ncbi:MAG: hypothetical protein GY869_04020, partial [Planctomycetes bacterium]|nr:hypothetical protein [Planctomycetota bacterium]
MKLADKYGMNVIPWSYKRGTPRLGRRMENLNPPRPKNLPLKERLKIQRAIYEKGQPIRIAETKLLRDHKNLIGYWNFDEPNLGNKYERIAIAEWYWNTVNKIDPYRPLFLLYSMQIPHGDIWTNWGQLLGFDIYPRPFTGRIYSEPGLYTAYYAYRLRERCRQDNKVMFLVP